VTSKSIHLIALALPWLLAAQACRAEDRSNSEIFNGKNLDGWEGLSHVWSVKDGAIVGTAPPEGLKFNTFLCTKQPYKDFELHFKIRLREGKGNSGVQIRSRIFDRRTFAVEGPQCDIGDFYWGSLYGEHFGGMMQLAPRQVVMRVLKKDDFNDYYIRCVGKHVTIKLNGATTVDADFPKMPDDGIIALQMHQGYPNMEVTFKEMRLTDLSAK
jgi:hypothetical protein